MGLQGPCKRREKQLKFEPILLCRIDQRLKTPPTHNYVKTFPQVIGIKGCFLACEFHRLLYDINGAVTLWWMVQE